MGRSRREEDDTSEDMQKEWPGRTSVGKSLGRIIWEAGGSDLQCQKQKERSKKMRIA